VLWSVTKLYAEIRCLLYRHLISVNFCGFRCATTSPITVFINFVFYIYIIVYVAICRLSLIESQSVLPSHRSVTPTWHSSPLCGRELEVRLWLASGIVNHTFSITCHYHPGFNTVTNLYCLVIEGVNNKELNPREVSIKRTNPCTIAPPQTLRGIISTRLICMHTRMHVQKFTESAASNIQSQPVSEFTKNSAIPQNMTKFPVIFFRMGQTVTQDRCQ